MPERKSGKLHELELKYDALISKIDTAITSKEDNLKKIYSEANEIFNELPKIVNNRKDYQVTEYKGKQTKANLKLLKNRLVLAMAYAFEYASEKKYAVDGLYKIQVDRIIPNATENRMKLTLTSKYGQTIKENRHLLIHKIEFNGQEKKVDYKINDNYAFADIEFDSLQKGTYKVHGILRFYTREKKFDIPFQKEFQSK